MKPATQEKWIGRWEQFLGSLRKAWGILIGDAAIQADGDFQRKFGEMRERSAVWQERTEQTRRV